MGRRRKRKKQNIMLRIGKKLFTTTKKNDRSSYQFVPYPTYRNSNTFNSERELEDFFFAQPGYIEPGMTLQARQKRTAAGIIDLFGTDRMGRITIIELKKGPGSDDVVGQILRYISVISIEYQIPTEHLRGIIICSTISNNLRYSVNALHNVEAYEYKTLLARSRSNTAMNSNNRSIAVMNSNKKQFCTNCGSQISSNFCMNCGTKTGLT